jgi:hypothetical protein
MTNPSTPPALATALAYHQAWTSHNLDEAMNRVTAAGIMPSGGAGPPC